MLKKLVTGCKRFVLCHQKILAVLIVIGAVIFILPTMYINMEYKNTRYDLEDPRPIPAKDVAIVLGAGVRADGSPTPYLRGRLETASILYKKKLIKKILVSGDNSSKKYDEPTAMKRYLVGLGVPASDVVVDYAGFNTYDTCYRAKHIFGVTNALVITQGYHLPRAVLTCSGLGISTLGVAATSTSRDYTAAYIIREYVSTSKAVLQLAFKPKPTALGSSEPIQF